MNDHPTKTAILVVGMHRSGTSALTRVLSLLGCDLPKTLMEPVPDNNELGFWESRPICDFNDEILASAGSAWDDWREFDSGWYSSPVAHEFRARAQDMLREEFGNSRFFVLKDPRLCQLLPFWNDAVSAFGAKPYVLSPIRNPLDVAMSLEARDGVDRSIGYLLWLRSVLEAEVSSRNLERTYLRYEALVCEPHNALDLMGHSLGISWPRRVSADTELDIDDFISPESRHHRAEDDAFLANPRLSSWIKSSFQIFDRWTRGDVRRSDSAKLGQIRSAFNAATAIFSRPMAANARKVAELDTELHVLREDVADRTRQNEVLRDDMADRDVRIESLHQGISERDSRLEALHQGISERDSRLEALHQGISERDSRLEALHQGISVRDSRLEALHQGISERDSRLEALHQGILERDSRLEALHQGISERDSRLEALHQGILERDSRLEALHQGILERDSRLEALHQGILERDSRLEALHQGILERDSRLEALHQGISERDSRLEALHQGISERDSRLEALHQQVDERGRQIAALYASNSWRLTAPLRHMRSLSRQGLDSLKHPIYRLLWFVWHHLPLAVRRRVFRGPLARDVQRLKRFLERRSHASPPEPEERRSAGPAGSPPEILSGPIDESSGSEFVANDARPISAPPGVRIIAFYLPQFHPIPENDEWWGKGFTEWTNVTRAAPLFDGHYQPHLPADLGFYDLRVRDVRHQQVALARTYGVDGFCFYLYWFEGRRLLEGPLDAFVDDHSIDFPFCICWANESWTRTWDGLEREVLIQQNHSAANDLRFIRDVSRYLKQENYIRIDGRPLLVVYRPGQLPEPRQTAERWREWCREFGIGEIHLSYTQSFEIVDPAKFGFDSAIEFPPNLTSPPNVEHEVVQLNSQFSGSIYDWSVFPDRSERYSTPSYPLFRAVNTGWDNTARRGSAGTVFVNSSPALYWRWLVNAIRDTKKRFPAHDERLVFVNAWNEWAEGAHLEPDRRFGFGYLEATRAALEHTAADDAPGVLYVTHDGHPHGAQLNALAQVDGLIGKIGVRVHVAALGDGELLERFEAIAPVHRIWEATDAQDTMADLARRLKERGITRAILNTAVCGGVAAVLKDSGFTVVSLIHELPGVIRSMGLGPSVSEIAENADSVVFASTHVHAEFEKLARVRGEVHIRPQGVYKANRYKSAAARSVARRQIRSKLGIDDGATIVLNVGFGDERKGIDLFLEIANRVTEDVPGVHFVWVGRIHQMHVGPSVQRRMEMNRDGNRIHMVGWQEDPQVFYAGSDVLALTSREDPFPSTVLEAMDAGIPVVGFEGAGGFADLLRQGAGRLAPYGDLDEFARIVCNLVRNRDKAELLGARGRELIAEQFGWTKFLVELARIAGLPMHRISVVVPNYNYKRYLDGRLASILGQTYPIYELIILDDASSDGSREWLENEVPLRCPEARLVFNEHNAGSPFAQWRKGAQLATGDVIWIAEADDLCEPDFLRTVVQSFDEPRTILSYCQSQQMLEDGSIGCMDYLEYTADLCSDRWRTDYVEEGREEIRHYFAVKNVVPNVSGTLIRRQVLADVMSEWLDRICSLRIAGDWLTYVLCLGRGGVVNYHARALNKHRRHDGGITIGNSNRDHLREILAVQQFIGAQFDVPDAVRQQCWSYSRTIYAQFGLDETVDGTIEEIAESSSLVLKA